MSRVLLKVTVLLVSCLVALLTAEAAVRALGLFEDARAAVDMAVEAAGEPEKQRRFGKLIHPYRGWIARPGHRASFLKKDKPFFPDGLPSEWALANSTGNRFGYLSQVEDYRELSPEQFVIGIFGGSVASQLATIGGDAIERGIVERRPDLEGKVVVVNVSSGAYKQPQQLFALSELLLLGAPFDVVVNVDGFNEVVFGLRDALDGYHPFLPSRGQYLNLLDLTSSDPTVEAITSMAEIHHHRQAVDGLTAVFSGSAFFRASELFKAIVGVLAQRHQRAIVEVEAALQSQSVQPHRFPAAEMLSDPCLGPEGDCDDLVGSLWERGSRLMAAAADQFGAEYVHVLQPNQYVERSKTMTPAEIEIAYDPRSGYAKRVRQGYPILQRRGQEMAGDGISFHDLSMIFRDRQEALYVDNCCHYNHLGYQIVGDAVAALIVTSTQ
jgi:hypothetical protein